MSGMFSACASVTNRSQRGPRRLEIWLRGGDLNPRPLGYEPNELPDCSTPRYRKRFIVARAPRIAQLTFASDIPRQAPTSLKRASSLQLTRERRSSTEHDNGGQHER